MIEKKRLEELIEQGATIWTVNRSGNINSTKANKTCEIQRQYLMKEGQKYSYIAQTFETKEEAEWHKEFGCIERTERLELPTWEEFKVVSFNDKYGKSICLEKAYGNIYLQKCNEFYVEDVYFKEKATKENYTLACRKAKELFLGEKR